MTFRQYPTQSVTVAATVLRICGASSWTGANAYRGDVIYEICNVGASDIYVRPVAVGDTLTGAVSSTLFQYKLAAGETIAVRQCDNEGASYDLAVVSASSSVVNVTPKVVTNP